MKKRYVSDVSREQFEMIKEYLEPKRRKTRPREVDLYDIFCGLLYLLKSGCQWRMLPKEYPKWQTIYAYFREWNKKEEGYEKTVLELVLKKINWRGSYVQFTEREY